MKSYWVYILQCSDKSYYIGVTNDLERRIQEHNYGIDKKCYTYKKNPCRLAYQEEYHDIQDAITREKQLKGWSRKKKEALILGDMQTLQAYASSTYGSTSSHRRKDTQEDTHTIYLALGSNQGNRDSYLRQAIQHLQKVMQIETYSKVYRTTPLGNTQEKNFLNMVVAGTTKLAPGALLTTCQEIEILLGRERIQDDIKRTIDIDIIFYDDITIETPTLTLPHPRRQERDFVLTPLKDIDPSYRAPEVNKSLGEIIPQYTTILSSYHLFMQQPKIVGILNLSPDSFSDGQTWTKEILHQRILNLIVQGADYIDIGAESTAPGSQPIDTQTEFQRLQDVFDLIQQHSYPITFSLDTMKAEVAKKGIEHGMHIINDVSGGRHDPHMFPYIAQAGVPFILMYCKNPSGRADMREIVYDDLIQHIIAFFEERIQTALAAGIQKEQLILDPGMGAFISPNPQDSITILQQLDKIRNYFNLPLFICTSRKGFHAKLSPDAGATQRLGSSLASSWYAIQQGVSYIRVHDVKEMRQFIDIYTALDAR